jgi:hypothetical protein
VILVREPDETQKKTAHILFYHVSDIVTQDWTFGSTEKNEGTTTCVVAQSLLGHYS